MTKRFIFILAERIHAACHIGLPRMDGLDEIAVGAG